MIPIPPHTATPPPSPSEIPQEGLWRITSDDITAPPEGPWSPDDIPQPSISKVHDAPEYEISKLEHLAHMSCFHLVSNALCAGAYVCCVWFPQPFSSSGAHLMLLLVEFAPILMLGTSVGQLDASMWLPKPSVSSTTHFGPPALNALPDSSFEELLSRESGGGTMIIKLIKAWKASLDKKRDLITSLAEVQSEIEDYKGDISTMLKKKKTAMHANNYYYHGHFVDKLTTIGQFKEEVSRVTLKPFSWTYGPEKEKTYAVSLVTPMHN
ncbi:hypothetical protein SCLCIDRAFT_23582 [Scleroderma citrinum Foug A]|uniref:Uncharacterized protein n=1 Tax=Scleroderma citrinum Foug A TaxID=1036808 RepID=A0A0C3E8A5_9AGAM|nr:hypothetical protein SCLCIDRAFT_23582 [Scleroderma citrinum Foug A]